MSDKPIFITTKTCGLCKPIKKEIISGKWSNLNITVVEDDIDVMMRYGVKSVPALVSGGTLYIGAKSVTEALEGLSGICS